ncbi:MAG: hypothetical protein V3R87_10580 [Dehalococcoidia bacterium]
MQDEGLPAFIAIMASTVLIIGVMIAAVILAVVLMSGPVPEIAGVTDAVGH